MTTATYNFAPGSTAWVLHDDKVEQTTVSQVSVVSNIYGTKTTYKVQLTSEFTLVDIEQLETQVNVVDSVAGLNGSFSVAGDLTAVFVPGVNFNIDNSDGNNGPYTILSSTYGVGPNTVITVTGNVPNSGSTGTLTYSQNPKIFPDVDSALAAYKEILTA